MVIAGVGVGEVLLTRMGLLLLAIGAVLAGLRWLNAEMGGDDFRGSQ
ncbi:hypothetical protein DSM112329_02289 [Paraconexibacter sp. AEG42_29]|uniref:Uncharacterized protein n=2 Tax=Paraconexibacter sp. AEG42_29 TaxID=2997339 RepID=A0AAU7AUW8_9ACTN